MGHDTELSKKLVDTARRHLCDAEEMMEAELPTEMSGEEESEYEAKIRGRFLAASKAVIHLIEMGAHEEARAVQSDLTRWVNHHTDDQDPAVVVWG
jgi:hypothetical protein